MSARLRTISDGVQKRLKGLIDREKAMQGFLNRDVVEAYRNIQRKRWVTENASEAGESGRWTALNADYARAKLKRFAGYEGGGKRMLIATGKLYKSVIGPGAGFRKVATNKSLTISTSVEYAQHVDEARSFTTYGKDSIRGLRTMIRNFMFHNKLGVFKK